MMSETFPWIKPLYTGTLNNRNHWQDLAEKVEMGYGILLDAKPSNEKELQLK